MYRVFDCECIDKLIEDFEEADEYAILNACAIEDNSGQIIADYREE